MNNLTNVSLLQSLPIELQTEIFSKLKKTDLAIVLATAKHFNGLLQDDYFWKNDGVMPCFQPASSNKDRLLQTYRSYCQFFATHYPELKKEASPNIFEQKKRTDEFLSNLIQKVDFNGLMIKILLEKPEIMSLVGDVVLNLPPSNLANIIINSVKNAKDPNETLFIINELNINFKNWPEHLHDKIYTAAILNRGNLLTPLSQMGLEPGLGI